MSEKCVEFRTDDGCGELFDVVLEDDKYAAIFTSTHIGEDGFGEEVFIAIGTDDIPKVIEFLQGMVKK